MTVELRKKLNLLEFQKTLNAQFLEIFEDKKNNTDVNLIKSSSLGLGEVVMNYRFFFPLKDLKNISGDNKCESMPLTKPWITGFNQIRGNVFTIIDFHRVIEYILNNNEQHVEHLTNESNILYIKDNSESHMGLVVNSLSLEYTGEFTKIFKCNNTENKINWNLEDGIIFDSFVKKENMSNEEFNILITLQEFSNKDMSITNENMKDINELSDEMKLLEIFISDIYLDALGNRPIFVVDLQRLTKFLMSVSPF
jgi:chemotaxis signal transduction protein